MHSADETYSCRRCDTAHEGLPFSYYAPAPAYWLSLPEDVRTSLGVLGEENCEVGDQHFFVRGRIYLPVIGSDQYFEWGVWVSLSRKNYERTLNLWQQPGRESEPPYFGWLQTHLPY